MRYEPDLRIEITTAAPAPPHFLIYQMPNGQEVCTFGNLIEGIAMPATARLVRAGMTATHADQLIYAKLAMRP